jgi:hypothetical protein
VYNYDYQSFISCTVILFFQLRDKFSKNDLPESFIGGAIEDLDTQGLCAIFVWRCS